MVDVVKVRGVGVESGVESGGRKWWWMLMMRVVVDGGRYFS